MPTPLSQYDPQIAIQKQTENLDEMTLGQQKQNAQNPTLGSMGPNVSAMSQQLNVGGPMPEVMSNMASLEAAMLMGNSRNPPGNIWTQPIVQKNMQKEALGLEREAQDQMRAEAAQLKAQEKAEAEKLANRQRFDAIVQQKQEEKAKIAERKANVIGLAQGFGRDPEDPENIKKFAALSRLIEAKAPANVLDAFLLESGLAQPEEKEAPKRNTSRLTVQQPGVGEVSQLIDDDTGEVIRERVVKPMDYETPAEITKREKDTAGLKSSLKAITGYQDALKESGYEANVPFNREDAGKLGGLYSDTRNTIRQLWDLGVLQKADIELLEKSLGDPTGKSGVVMEWGGGAAKDIAFLDTYVDKLKTKLADLDPDVIAARRMK